MKWAKMNFVARHYDPYVQGHQGHNGVQQNSSWAISLCGDPYVNSPLQIVNKDGQMKQGRARVNEMEQMGRMLGKLERDTT